MMFYLKRMAGSMIKRWMVILSALFLFLSATDGILTYWAVNHGYQENNILMESISKSVMFPILKIITALVILSLVWLVFKLTALSKFHNIMVYTLAMGSGVLFAVNISNLITLGVN